MTLIIKKIINKAPVFVISSGDMILPFARRGITVFGCRILYSSFLAFFMIIISLSILRPPAVDPAQEPTSINRTRIIIEAPFQSVKCEPVKPVDVIADVTWKNVSTIRVFMSVYSPLINKSTTMNKNAKNTMAIYQRNVSFLNNARPLPIAKLNRSAKLIPASNI